MQWHIARTVPGQDSQAAETLRGKCYLVYNPVCYRRVRLSRGRFVRRLQPMFPGYLIVERGGQSWERLRTAPGIIQGDPLVRTTTGEFATLPPAVFDEIRRAELAKMVPLEVPPAFQTGDELKIIDGPWSGYFGPVDRLDGDSAVRLLLDVFGRTTPVSIPMKFVAPVENSGLGASF